MPVKKAKGNKLVEFARSRGVAAPTTGSVDFGDFRDDGRLKQGRSKQNVSNRSVAPNLYTCAMEKNQNGKYNIRVRVTFGQGSWSLAVYFLASSFNAAMKKLEQSLQLLQKNEERLRFWGVERTDDPNMAGDLLQEFGLWLDRRREFPRKYAEIAVGAEKPVAASMLAPLRRVLADSVSQERERAFTAAAGD
jgi:hypothetical protein